MSKKALIYEFSRTTIKWSSLFDDINKRKLMKKMITTESGQIFLQSHKFDIHKGSNISVKFDDCDDFFSGYVNFQVVVTADTFTDADEKSIEKRINTFFKAVDEKIEQLYTLKKDMELLKHIE